MSKRKEIAIPAEPAIPTSPALPSLPAEPAIPETIKPGYGTSEFWITLVSTIVPNLITLLAIFKIVPNEIASILTTSLVAVISGIITIIVAIRYIKSRTEVKIKCLQIQDNIRSRNYDIRHTDRQFLLQLHEKGLVDNNRILKEFNLI